MTTPKISKLIERARSMIPTLMERAPSEEKKGQVSITTIRKLQENGFIRVLQPKRWGGFELHPSIFADLIIELSRGDQSVGWLQGLFSAHSYHLAMFDERAQRDVWKEDRDSLLSSPYSPMGIATPYKDGFIFSGRWWFASGCDHADWAMLGGLVENDSSKHMIFLVPKKEISIIDDWDVLGLKATGSKQIVVKDSYVPGFRTLPFWEGADRMRLPGQHLNTGPLYRIPFTLILNSSIVCNSIGALQSFIDTFVPYTLPKKDLLTRIPLVENPDAQLYLGQAVNLLEELKILLHHDLRRLFDLASAGELPSSIESLKIDYRTLSIPPRCLEAARALFEVSGGGAAYETRPLARILRNLSTGRNHQEVGYYRQNARDIAKLVYSEYRQPSSKSV